MRNQKITFVENRDRQEWRQAYILGLIMHHKYLVVGLCRINCENLGYRKCFQYYSRVDVILTKVLANGY